MKGRLPVGLLVGSRFLSIFLILLFSSFIFAQPKIPKESNLENIFPELKIEMEKLYSAQPEESLCLPRLAKRITAKDFGKEKNDWLNWYRGS